MKTFMYYLKNVFKVNSILAQDTFIGECVYDLEFRLKYTFKP